MFTVYYFARSREITRKNEEQFSLKQLIQNNTTITTNIPSSNKENNTTSNATVPSQWTDTNRNINTTQISSQSNSTTNTSSSLSVASSSSSSSISSSFVPRILHIMPYLYTLYPELKELPASSLLAFNE